MYENNFAGFHIRKWFTHCEETLANETGALADGEPVFKYVLAAAIRNPFTGVFAEDLSPIIDESPALGLEFGRRIAALAGERSIQSYGKAILV
ncbi:MAG: amino acid synthesis family protein, partial [Pseudomonadota bacterium]